MTNARGLTLIEFCVAIIIVTILASIAVPGYSRWLPGHKLKSASLQLLSSMHLAKMTAIRLNRETAVVFFDQPAVDTFEIWEGGANEVFDDRGGDDVLIKTVNVTDFGSGVGYGLGNAPNGAGGGAADITFNTHGGNPEPVVIFDGRGMANGNGFAHLDNQKNTRSYAVGALASGVIRFRRWNGTNWD